MKNLKTNTKKLHLLKNKVANVTYLGNIKGGVEGDEGNPGKSNRTSGTKPSNPDPVQI